MIVDASKLVRFMGDRTVEDRPHDLAHLAWAVVRFDVVSIPAVASIAFATKPEATRIARPIRVSAPTSVIGLPSSIPGGSSTLRGSGAEDASSSQWPLDAVL